MTSQNSAQRHLAEAKTRLDVHFDGYKDTLIELAKIPGIAWDAFDAGELERSAQAV